MPGIDATEPAERRREAEAWCDRFEENTRQVAEVDDRRARADGEPQLSYEDVDTTLIPPRPRLYGLVGGEVIEQVWKERQAAKTAGTASGNGTPASGNSPRAAVKSASGKAGAIR